MVVVQEYVADPILTHIETIRTMLDCGVQDVRAIRHNLVQIEIEYRREREVYAEMDRPALPEQIKALEAMAADLGIHVSMPPKMSYGQAVIQGVRWASLDRKRRAVEASRTAFRIPVRVAGR